MAGELWFYSCWVPEILEQSDWGVKPTTHPSFVPRLKCVELCLFLFKHRDSFWILCRRNIYSNVNFQRILKYIILNAIEWVAPCIPVWKVQTPDFILEMAVLAKVVWLHSICRKMPAQYLKLSYDYVIHVCPKSLFSNYPTVWCCDALTTESIRKYTKSEYKQH